MPILTKPKNKLYQFLKSTEKYTKTDNIYLARGGFWLTIAKVGITAIGLVMGVLWSKFIPKEIYGQYKFILSITALLAIFSLPGMKSATTQAVARGFEGTVKTVLEKRFRWSVLTFIGGVCLAFYYWLNQNNILAISFLLAGLFSPAINCLPIYTNYLAGKKRFDLQAKLSFSKSFFAALATALAILATNNVIYLLLVYFISRNILNIFFYFFALKRLPPNQKVDPEAITFGKHLSFLSILGRLAEHIDKILIFHYLGAAQVAIYSFAVLMPEQIKGFTKSLGQMAMPKLSIRSSEEIKKAMWQKTTRLGILLIIMVAGYIILSPFVFKILFPNYTESILFSRIYALHLLTGVSMIPETSFIAKRKTKLLYKRNILLHLIKIVIIFIGIYFFGLLGLVVAFVVQSFILSAIDFFMFRYL